MKFIDLSPDVLAIIVDGKVTKSDIKDSERKMEALLQNHKGLNIYIEILQLEGYEVDAFFEDLKLSLKNFENFDKIALVSEQSWIEKFADIISNLGSLEIKVFEINEIKEARDWITAESDNNTDTEQGPGKSPKTGAAGQD